jgi:glycosyltransferase involved in cell wall biosynthesis
MKGLDTLLRAFLLLPQSRFHVVIIGRGPDEERLRQLAADLRISESVSFLGSVPNENLCDYLADADVYVFPSLTEGWPKSVFESMVMGKPIVASKIAGIAEVLEDGKSAILFEPSNPKDLAAKILKASDDKELASRLGENARSKAAKLYAQAKDRTALDICL